MVILDCAILLFGRDGFRFFACYNFRGGFGRKDFHVGGEALIASHVVVVSVTVDHVPDRRQLQLLHHPDQLLGCVGRQERVEDNRGFTVIDDTGVAYRLPTECVKACIEPGPQCDDIEVRGQAFEVILFMRTEEQQDKKKWEVNGLHEGLPLDDLRWRVAKVGSTTKETEQGERGEPQAEPSIRYRSLYRKHNVAKAQTQAPTMQGGDSVGNARSDEDGVVYPCGKRSLRTSTLVSERGT
jgi:hypothetical protein